MVKALEFEGKGFEYFKIWIVNLFLIVITLGIYYPWAKVRKRRYFHANTYFDDRNFEYHATGKQLFLGYLIAVGLLIVYVILEKISMVSNLVGVAIFVIALPWIIWRSMQFNLRMTSFSQVRFSFDGSLGHAYLNFMVLPAIAYALISFVALIMFKTFENQAWVTLVLFIIAIILYMLIFAYIQMRNSRYNIGNIRYGQGQLNTQFETAGFVKIIFKTLALSLLFMVIFLVIISAIVYANIELGGVFLMQEIMSGGASEMDMAEQGLLLGIFAFLYIGVLLMNIFIWAYFYTRKRAYLLDNSILDGRISFSSTLTARSFAWVLLSNLLLIILTLGLAMPWASVRVARVVIENTTLVSSTGFDEYVTQQQREQSSLGEQIGDAFDVGVDIGI